MDKEIIVIEKADAIKNLIRDKIKFADRMKYEHRNDVDKELYGFYDGYKTSLTHLLKEVNSIYLSQDSF